MVNLPSLLATAFRNKPRRTVAAGCAIAVALSVGTAGIVYNMADKDIDPGALWSAVAIDQASAAVAGGGGMGINEFLAASRALRFLPPERTWWNLKGGKLAPKVFGAIAPNDPAEDPGTSALPEAIAPVAFSAFAPDGGAGDGDLGNSGGLTPQSGPSPLATGPTNLPNPSGPTGIVPATTPGGIAVPEPASWALMILGFGAVGAAMRRKHAKDNRAASPAST